MYYNTINYILSSITPPLFGSLLSLHPMDLPFDTEHEKTKLAQVREREEEDIASILSDKYGMSYIDLSLKIGRAHV